MSARRFFAIVFIFGTVTVAWMVLGGSMWVRTEMLDRSLSQEMENLWGASVVAQSAPIWSSGPKGDRRDTKTVTPTKSVIQASISHQYRDKGLLWYSTFTMSFSGEYTIPPAASADNGSSKGFFHFRLPKGTTPMDLTVSVDGETVELPYDQKVSGQIAIPVYRSTQHVISLSFKTAGQDMWVYCPGRYEVGDDSSVVSSSMGELRNFTLTITTDFTNIDYPRGSRSPSKKATQTDGGMSATWRYQNLITRQPMGIAMPKRDNAGPIAARMSFFAPVSLFFFFTVLFTVVILKKIPLHPMHYLFIAAGFFAFHILLAYLADQIPIHWAFWICAIVSVALVVSYLHLVGGVRFAVFYAGAAQLVYLVGFSYAFFWVGKTGLTVTIGAVATLFVLMQATGRLNWFEVFKQGKKNESDKWTNVIPPLPDAVTPEGDDENR